MLVIVLVTAVGGAAQGELIVADSLEWLVADSDVIVTGVIVSDPPGSDAYHADLTLQVSEVLKGEATDRLRFSTPVYDVQSLIADLRTNAVNVLAFLKQDGLQQLILPAGENVSPMIHNWSIWRGAITMEGQLLWRREQILESVKDAIEYGKHHEPPLSASIEVLGLEAWSVLYAGSSAYLVVPRDDRLRTVAHKWINGSDPFLQAQGVSLLELDAIPEDPAGKAAAPLDAALAISSAVQLIANGSFEQRLSGEAPEHILTLTPDSTELASWTMVEGSVDWIGPTRWQPADGRASLDLDAPGAIRQKLRTKPGQLYVLSFDMAGNVEMEPALKQLAVTVNGERYEFEFDAGGRTADAMGWARCSIAFRAESETTTLTFANASPIATASGVALDHVSCQPVDAESRAALDQAGRYALQSTDGRFILLDTATGRTWLLEDEGDGGVWRPIEHVQPEHNEELR
jgi:choice-of-anchor C domain-containing protein